MGGKDGGKLARPKRINPVGVKISGHGSGTIGREMGFKNKFSDKLRELSVQNYESPTATQYFPTEKGRKDLCEEST